MGYGDDNDPSWLNRLFLKIQALASPRVAKHLDIPGHPVRDILYRTALDFLYESIYRVEQVEEALVFVGRGHAPTKTTPRRIVNTLAEEFTIGSEILLVWGVPPEALRDMPVLFRGHWVPSVGGEVAKTVTWEISITSSDGGTDMSTVAGTFTLAASAYPETQYESTHTEASFNLEDYMAADEDILHVAAKRVTTGADPTSHPWVHRVSVIYYKQRSLISWPL